MGAVDLVELWRGGLAESVHRGHAVVHDGRGVAEAWGDPRAVIFPRSSAKMIQALPLVLSGAADGLGSDLLALACASHAGAPAHTERVGRWLADLGLGEADLRCGAHAPADRGAAEALLRTHEAPCQLHNNCSGKHAGFLHLARHLDAGPEYVEIDHPVQAAARAAFEEETGEQSPGWGVDGCSAPNFATTVEGLARAMAAFAGRAGGGRGEAHVRLREAMMAHPELVAGEGRACTDLMRACGGRAAIKEGAEGVYVAILPERGLGVALKVADGAMRAAEATMAALLVRLGALDGAHPVAERLMHGPIRNWRGIETGRVRSLIG
jgi:L-asparaginase II